jgi:hypothetical protein
MHLTTRFFLELHSGQDEALFLMTLHAFIRLNTAARMAHVHQYGSFITHDPARLSNYYLVDDFYVEVRVNDEGTGLLGVMPFRTGMRFERMVERINLSRL